MQYIDHPKSALRAKHAETRIGSLSTFGARQANGQPRFGVPRPGPSLSAGMRMLMSCWRTDFPRLAASASERLGPARFQGKALRLCRWPYQVTTTKAAGNASTCGPLM